MRPLSCAMCPVNCGPFRELMSILFLNISHPSLLLPGCILVVGTREEKAFEIFYSSTVQCWQGIKKLRPVSLKVIASLKFVWNLTEVLYRSEIRFFQRYFNEVQDQNAIYRAVVKVLLILTSYLSTFQILISSILLIVSKLLIRLLYA